MSFTTLLHADEWRPAWRSLMLTLMLAVCWLAFTPNPTLPSIGDSDKIDHLVAFVSLGAVAALCGPAGRRHSLAMTAGLLGFGLFIEFVQLWVPGRSAEWLDVLADAAGAAAGLALMAGLRRSFAR